MSNLTTYADQSIFDIALQAYGSVEGVFELLKANAGLQLDSHIVPGTIIQVPNAAVKQAIVDYYTKNNIKPASGNVPGLPVYNKEVSMIIQKLDFQISVINQTLRSTGVRLYNLSSTGLATLQINYSGINNVDVKISLETSLDGISYGPLPGSGMVLDNTKSSHTYYLTGLMVDYIRLKVESNSATSGYFSKMLIQL